METYASVTFDDSIKVQIPNDTIYLSLAFPAKTNFIVKYLTSSYLHDAMIIKTSVVGEHVYGMYIVPKDTIIWNHDSLIVSFEYYDDRSSSFFRDKEYPKETFVVQNVVLNIPLKKTVKYLEY